ncbi:MAG: endonuclease Q family protein [Armatimonadota bacterium]
MLIIADLHVHIGAATCGQVVKVTASRDLTFDNILVECVNRKGVDLVGIVDCASPAVIADIDRLIDTGEMTQLDGGGLRFRDRLTVLLGSEVETRERGRGMSHHVSFFPHLGQLKAFSREISKHLSNPNLSSQACGLSAQEMCDLALQQQALFIPAHCFTPHKSVYGSCCERAADLFGEYWDAIPAIELGLSADADLADRLGELEGKTFLSNSDAHSLPKIAREYNVLEIEDGSFDELRKALWREEGRGVMANFGLDPRLGKYHRTCCEKCGWLAQEDPPVLTCEQCASADVTRGVLDRIHQIASHDAPQPPEHRAPYQYQVPLQFVPGVGSALLAKLINRFGSEMAVLHQASRREIGETVGQKVADLIIAAREGTMALQSGGGGRYGRAIREGEGQIRLPGV